MKRCKTTIDGIEITFDYEYFSNIGTSHKPHEIINITHPSFKDDEIEDMEAKISYAVFNGNYSTINK